ncbi:MAG: A/G-specific adenine glycosylase [Bradymonadales bacterium]|nr:MAG: A/G-specific adenine glycosylase [Bradymonadales bacterium]
MTTKTVDWCLPQEFRLEGFQSALVRWFAKEARDLPWRRTKDPYHIWISEMMCQQTGVQTVVGYYQRFIEKFPDMGSLARAEPDEVLRLWEGLGYYSRARNIHRAAQILEYERKGRWPKTRREILELPGIGAYSAGAILSIAFSRPEAALDGNVIRVLSRIFQVKEPVDQAQTLKRLWGMAQALVPKKSRWIRAHTEGMMELGARICLPRGGLCSRCPVSRHCLSAHQTEAKTLPRKTKPKKRVKLQESIFLLQRRAKIAVLAKGADPKYPLFYRLPFISGPYSPYERKMKYSITHRDIEVFVSRSLSLKSLQKKIKWVESDQLQAMSFPAIDRKVIQSLLV